MLLDYFNSAPMLTLAIGQGGDYIGGEKATRFNDGIQPMRKAMNSFICSVDRPFQFVGRINEDVNTYVLLGSRGGDNFCPSYKSASTNSKRRATAGGA